MQNYFGQFNYSLANEDTRVEKQAFSQAERVFAVCGSGSRVLPLIHSGLKSIEVVDVSAFQLQYLQFKIELIQKLSHDDFLKVLGYLPASIDERKKIFKELRLSQGSEDLVGTFAGKHLLKGFIYLGRWENYIQSAAKLIHHLSFTDFGKFFDAKSKASQMDLYEKDWPKKRLAVLLRIIANPVLINRKLYKGSWKDFETDNLIPFLENNFAKAFSERLLSESFFHQLLFLGELSKPEGFPEEASLETYNNVRRFKGEIRYLEKDLMQCVSLSKAQAFSLSDVPSYLPTVALKQLGELMSGKLETKGHQFVLRTFLRHPQILGPSRDFRKSEVEALARKIDSTMLYQFQIFQNL